MQNNLNFATSSQSPRYHKIAFLSIYKGSLKVTIYVLVMSKYLIDDFNIFIFI